MKLVGGYRRSPRLSEWEGMTAGIKVGALCSTLPYLFFLFLSPSFSLLSLIPPISLRWWSDPRIDRLIVPHSVSFLFPLPIGSFSFFLSFPIIRLSTSELWIGKPMFRSMIRYLISERAWVSGSIEFGEVSGNLTDSLCNKLVHTDVREGKFMMR